MISTSGGGNKVGVAGGGVLVASAETTVCCPVQLDRGRVRMRYKIAQKIYFLFIKRLASRLWRY
jgi:hypothetical protein